jgi:hypothetical protein
MLYPNCFIFGHHERTSAMLDISAALAWNEEAFGTFLKAV